MKKIITLLAAVVLTFGLITATAETQETQLGLINPITQYETLEEINELSGVKLTAPAVMGVTDISFATIAGGEFIIGEYRFELNGTAYTLRGSGDVTQDISGIYINAEPAFTGSLTEEIQYANDDSVIAARWFTVDGQYTLAAENNEIDEDIFRSLAEELKIITCMEDGI